MTQPTHTDLQRDFGRMEGRMDSLDRALTDGFKRVEDALTKIDSRLDSLDAKESERKGAWKVVTIVAGGVSFIVSVLVPMIIDWFTGP